MLTTQLTTTLTKRLTKRLSKAECSKAHFSTLPLFGAFFNCLLKSRDIGIFAILSSLIKTSQLSLKTTFFLSGNDVVGRKEYYIAIPIPFACCQWRSLGRAFVRIS